VICGSLESYFKENVFDAAFPALSLQLPETEALELSGPEYMAGKPQLALSIPETASDFVQLRPTGLEYQPLKSGLRPGLTEIVGPVASYLMESPTVAEFVALSVQVTESETDAESGPE
jgi:hypothetical protein